jgi:hypothetical protein
MNLKLCAAGFCAAVIAVTACYGPSAEAAQKKRVVTHTKQRVTQRVVTSRPRARIVVRNRSFLDPGTESLPGESRDQDYAFPSGYSPARVIENTPFYHRSPLPGPFDLPGQDNPWPWNW